MGSLNRSTLSILSVLGACFCFSAGDAAVKLLSGDYPLYQIVLIRSSIGLFICLTFFVPLEGGFKALKTRRPLAHISRGLCVVVCNTCFFAGVIVLPIAEATAIFFVAPLLITLMTNIILGEKVGLQRWGALFFGLLGVFLIVRPMGITFRWESLFPLMGACAYATLHTITRNMGLSEKASTMSVYIHLTFLTVYSVFGITFGDGNHNIIDHPSANFLFRGMSYLDKKDIPLFIWVGLTSAFGGYLIGQAYRSSSAGLVAPFEYTTVVLSVFWGLILWGEYLTLFSFLGIFIIIISGIFVAKREKIKHISPTAKRISGRR